MDVGHIMGTHHSVKLRDSHRGHHKGKLTVRGQPFQTPPWSYRGLFAGQKSFENTVVKGIIVAIRNDLAIVDVGLKSEGRVPLKEIHTKDQEEVRVGDTIDVYVERLEDKNGEVVLSIEKARREAAWDELEKAHEDGLLINGTIFGRVKGGFAVDLNGAIAFLPGSQVDIRPIRDISALMNILQPFKLLKNGQSTQQYRCITSLCLRRIKGRGTYGIGITAN